MILEGCGRELSWDLEAAAPTMFQPTTGSFAYCPRSARLITPDRLWDQPDGMVLTALPYTNFLGRFNHRGDRFYSDHVYRTLVYDAITGDETNTLEGASAPCWTGEDRLAFLGDGQVRVLDLKTGHET